MSQSIAWKIGNEAYEDDESVDSNPYARGSWEHGEWGRGWMMAEAQEETDAFDFTFDEPSEEEEFDGLDWELEINEIDDCDYEKDFSGEPF